LERALARLQRRTGWKWNVRGDEVQYAHIVHSQVAPACLALHLNILVRASTADTRTIVLVAARPV
jgi:hypothetical protein